MPLQQPVRAKRIEDRPDEYFTGIPNKDLTEDEWQLLSDEQRATVEVSGFWKVKTDEQMAPAIARVEKAAEKATAKTIAALEKAADQPTEPTAQQDGGNP